jgi:Transposase, Mutator family
MRVMFEVTNPVEREHTMTRKEARLGVVDLKALLERDEEYFRAMVQSIVQATLEAEMAEAIGAEKGERTERRLSYRSGYYQRSLVTRVGTLELRVPQDRARPVLHGAVRTVPAFGESVGRGAFGDVCAGGLHP